MPNIFYDITEIRGETPKQFHKLQIDFVCNIIVFNLKNLISGHGRGWPNIIQKYNKMSTVINQTSTIMHAIA